MYAVAKEHRSTKLLTKVRRAPILDKFDGPINKTSDAIELNQICTAIKKSTALNNNNKTTVSKKQSSSPPSPSSSTTFTSASNHHRLYEDEEISAQHRDMIRYINDSWRCIQQELEYSQKNMANNNTSSGLNNCSINHTTKLPLTNGVVNGGDGNSTMENCNQMIHKNNSNHGAAAKIVKIKHISGSANSSIPKNFVPFDLESFFGQRFIQKLLQSSS